MLLRAVCVALLCALVGCGETDDDPSPDGTGGTATIVVDTDWLADHVTDPTVQLVDARASAAFAQSRIPGAIHLRPEQLAMDRGGVSSQVASPDVAETVLGAAGLVDDALVVVYGAPPEYDPARIVWALRYYGHDDVRYLDGGYAAWIQSGGEVDDAPPVVQTTNYVIDEVATDMRVTSDFVLQSLGDPPYSMPSIQLVDARSWPEYQAGRVPTARLVQWTENLEDGFLKSVEALRALHEGLDPTVTTVTYCLIGWRGSVAWLALEYLGYEDVRLYDGSWSEWGNGDFPVEP